MAIKLVKRKPLDIDEEEIMQIINDIQKYLIERSDFETNQQSMGIRVLFRGYIIKAWICINFTMKYTKLNRILMKTCTKYYYDCWIRRNEMLYNEAK